MAHADAIISAAEQRFAYVSFLVDRIDARGLENVDLQTSKGEALYQRYLAELDDEYGRKIADGLREVFVMLAAAERCRAHVFEAGKIIDLSAGDPALTPLDEQFDPGLPIDLLALLTHYDVSEGIDAYLLLMLEVARGTLRVSRANTGTTSFTLGLKAFGASVAADPACLSRLPAAFARLASVVLDAVDTIAEGRDGDGGARRLFRSLAPLVSAAVELSGSELLRARFADTDLVGVASTLDGEFNRQGLTTSRLPLHDDLRLALASSRFHSVRSLPVHRNALAGAYMKRGNAKQDAAGHGPGAAIPDFDAAIEVRETLRDWLRLHGEEAWTDTYRYALAAAYMDRGIAKVHAARHGPGAAIPDFDAAIELGEALRDRLRLQGEEAWIDTYRNVLAAAYMNRGNAKQHAAGHGPGAAIPDYDAAIEVREALRDRLRSQGEEAWADTYRNDLAAAYMNRGNAKQRAGYGPGAAIPDYDAAIAVREALRDRLRLKGEEAWTDTYRYDLAGTYMNRGTAKVHAGHGPAAAIPDFDAAIKVMEALRDRLRLQGEEAWTDAYRNTLTGAYMNRGYAKKNAAGHGPGAAIPDFDAAIEVGEALRDRLRLQGEEAWIDTYRNVLAAAYMNRGNAKQHAAGHGPGAAIPDYDAAIEVRETLRDRLQLQGEEVWTNSYRDDLAAAYMNRGNAKQDAAGHGPGAADPGLRCCHRGRGGAARPAAVAGRGGVDRHLSRWPGDGLHEPRQSQQDAAGHQRGAVDPGLRCRHRGKGGAARPTAVAGRGGLDRRIPPIAWALASSIVRVPALL